jgi:hypothetical protein
MERRNEIGGKLKIGSKRGFQVWPPTKIVPRKVLVRMLKIKRLFSI